MPLIAESASAESAAVQFAPRLITWQIQHGRHDLPWQTDDAYAVWLSEIMLQQTQVATVIPYYQRFIAAFPTVADLAAAPLDAVLAHWSGLGYYSRGRNLHAAARLVAQQFGGVFPDKMQDLLTLPGVGRSTAAAVAVFSSGERAAILDGNVRRVLCRWAGIFGYSGEAAVQQQLWQLAEALLPAEGPHVATRMRRYTQGLMDLGATVCTRRKPRCVECPLQADCVAQRNGWTDRLPSPKPRQPLPHKTVTLLLLEHAGRLLLQKRAAKGVWGGLWSLPEAEPGLDGDMLSGLSAVQRTVLPELAHSFTHFRLQIITEVWTARSPSEPGANASAVLPEAPEGCNWFEPDAALAAGIPTPIRRLIETWRQGAGID